MYETFYNFIVQNTLFILQLYCPYTYVSIKTKYLVGCYTQRLCDSEDRHNG